MKNQLVLDRTNSFSKNLIDLVETKFYRKDLVASDSNFGIKVGDILKIGYKIPEGTKERIQFYQGVVICIKNRNLGKSFTLRRIIQGIGIEQIFLLNSPKIISLVKKQSSKVRRAKLYFIRYLSGKATRLKIKR